MSFLKEFKEDLSQAVNELLPSGDLNEEFDDDTMVNTLENEDLDNFLDLEDLDSFFKENKEPEVSLQEEVSSPEQELAEEEIEEEIKEEMKEKKSEELEEPEELEVPVVPIEAEIKSEETKEVKVVSDEAAVITKGTKINGDIESDGSLDIVGTVIGNVSCNGKLTVTGTVNGNSIASEVFANAAKITGEVCSEGAVKIGLGSVVIGNVTATSAVIAGAINGDIDVKGPVIVDATAVIMGNIKSKSVQINNGAVIEGFCSQSYSDINVKDFFAEN